ARSLALDDNRATCPAPSVMTTCSSQGHDGARRLYAAFCAGVTMQIAIGTYEHTKALKDGSVNLPGVSFDFVEVSPITRAFRDMATRQAYDISEMALATYMLARIYDKPILGLPIVLVRSTLLPGLVAATDSLITDPTASN